MIVMNLREMEALGWVFSITGPNEGEWVKFEKGGCVVARQGSATWRMDLDKCMPGCTPRRRAYMYIRFEADLLDAEQTTAEAWGRWVVGRLVVPGINDADGIGRCTAEVTMYGSKDDPPYRGNIFDNRAGRPGGRVYDEREEPYREGRAHEFELPRAGEMGGIDGHLPEEEGRATDNKLPDRGDVWGRFARGRGASHD